MTGFKMDNNAPSNRMLQRKDGSKNDALSSFPIALEGFKKLANHISKPILISAVLLLIAQTTAGQAFFPSLSHPVDREVSGSGDEVSFHRRNHLLDSDNWHSRSDPERKVPYRNVLDVDDVNNPLATCHMRDADISEIIEVLNDDEVDIGGAAAREGNGVCPRIGCSRRAFEIINDVLQLKRTLRRLGANQTSVASHENLLLSYEEQFLALERNVKDGITLNEVSRTLAAKVCEFRDAYQQMRDRAGKSLMQFKETREKYFESRIRISIEKIENKEYSSAAKTFSSLQSPKLLEKILQSVYANTVDYVKVTLTFLKLLPTDIEYKIIVCTSLYEQMLKNNHLKNPEVLMLDNLISETIRVTQRRTTLCETHKDHSRMTALKHTLEPSIRHVLATWSVNIGNGSHQDILRLAESPFVNISQHLVHLTQLAYNDDLQNTEHILGFAKGLPSMSLSGIVYGTLFDEMHSNDDFHGDAVLLLAHRVKEVMDSVDFRAERPEARNRFKLVKKRLPDTVKFLLWERVCIMHRAFDGYLAGQAPSGEIGLLNSKSKVTVAYAQGHWRFLPVDEGKYFHIVNSHSNGCLSVSSKDAEYSLSLLSFDACTNNSDSKWTLSLSRRARVVTLRNLQNDVAIVAVIPPLNRRPVLRVVTSRDREYDEFRIEAC